MLQFVLLFFSFLPITLFIHNKLYGILDVNDEYGKYIAFLIMFCLLIPFCNTSNKAKWWILGVAHGMAHLIHPAFYGITYNTNYTPLWDYIIHAVSCLTIYEYHRTNFSKILSYVVFYSTLLVGYYAHCVPTFMTSLTWRFLSAGGVLGSTYHMLTLNTISEYQNKFQIYMATLVIFFLPYIGYTDYSFIPYWDKIMNDTGLFQLWFWNYFVVTEISHVILKCRVNKN